MPPTTPPPTAVSPFAHAIVGIDGRHGGRDAIALARALGARRTTLLCAYPNDPDAAFPAVPEWERALHDDTDRQLETARRVAGVDADLLAVPDTSPARALHRAATSLNADLIVVGSSEHGPVGRVVLGDVGRAVTHDSPCDVAVAPDRFRATETMPRAVLVGYDGSAEAVEALQRAAAIAQARDVPLRVCVVWQDPPVLAAATAYPGDLQAIEAENLEQAGRVLDAALAQLPARLEVQHEIRHGRPATELAAMAHSADLMVVGSRGWGAAHRVLVGSTADRLLHGAPCPVLLVSRPSGPQPSTGDHTPQSEARA